MWLYGGLLTDEWKSSDTFSQRNETDQRTIQTNNANMRRVHRRCSRRAATFATAIDLLDEVHARLRQRNIGEMYMALGFLEMHDRPRIFCNGIPLGRTRQRRDLRCHGPAADSTESTRTSVGASHSTARSLGQQRRGRWPYAEAGALDRKARMLVDQGQFAQAAAPYRVRRADELQYLLTFDSDAGDNELWSLNTSQPDATRSATASTSSRASSRTRCLSRRRTIRAFHVTDPKKKGVRRDHDASPRDLRRDAATRCRSSGHRCPADRSRGEAERRDFAGMMTILNALRTSAQKSGNQGRGDVGAAATPATRTPR